MFLSNLHQVNFNVAKYAVSPDLKYVLFAYDVKQVSDAFRALLDGALQCRQTAPPSCTVGSGWSDWFASGVKSVKRATVP